MVVRLLSRYFEGVRVAIYVFSHQLVQNSSLFLLQKEVLLLDMRQVAVVHRFYSIQFELLLCFLWPNVEGFASCRKIKVFIGHKVLESLLVNVHGSK
jgi:hypothetical protein